ncbi:hypothetical protein [Tautonia sociabilis]|uniref:Iron reductase n=1 Tax=Tautonia sociabilis TaxID=2080755 RepID=A0A432MIL3_9BACT|nr:hypothetical protein [Tautonia sociabilis]RUL87038.1 hypothetical protein TsocGM_14695 [Tautonia sociabilis]
MKERDRLAATGLVALMLVLWLGFLVHRSPRFAGSAWGGVLGVAGALVMLVPLAYTVVKRIPPLKRAVTPRVSLRTLLTWHVYAGIVGPILGLLHTGHKFESPLGIALTAMMLLVVLSGFVGRYLMGQVSADIREKKELLTQLELAYRETAGELAAHPDQAALLRPVTGFWARLAAGLLVRDDDALAATPIRALRLAESMADLEYAIRNHGALKRAFARWAAFHIVTSLALYALLALHIWSGLYFGLRWFP